MRRASPCKIDARFNCEEEIKAALSPLPRNTALKKHANANKSELTVLKNAKTAGSGAITAKRRQKSDL